MKRKKFLSILLILALTFSVTTCGDKQTVENAEESTKTIESISVDAKASIANLKTNGLINPIGIDDENPSFSWQMISDVRGAAQSAYQIVVNDLSGKQVWDSGKVESSLSVDIEYAGEALSKQTAYTWTVTVTDTSGNDFISEEAIFETGLMSTSFADWQGAKMIGASSLNVDAAYTCVFNISADVTIPEGSDTASIIVGGDDFRLLNSVYNTKLAEGKNYVRLELDISEIDSEDGVKFNSYRYGYSPDEEGETLIATVTGVDELNQLITKENCHETHNIQFNICASKIGITVDNTELKGRDLCINDLGNSSSYNTFPNLGKIGFAARANQSASFKNIKVENGGSYGRGELFGETTGAGYSIFSGLSGITVDSNTITVNGGQNGCIGYADPSFGSAPMLRKAFETKSDVKAARLYITAEGIYNFYINGSEVAEDEWFNPGYSEYDTYLAYNCYDVTDYLVDGSNAMGAVLAEGWWTGQMTYEASNSNYYGDKPALMALLCIEYADGSFDSVITDESWTSYMDGPVRAASFFQGERYDATKEAAVSGWTSADFDDSIWENACQVNLRKALSNVSLVTRYDNPVHVIEEKAAVSCLGETKDGSKTYIYDMGENVSGVPYITIPKELAKPGQTVTIRTAEDIYPEIEEYIAAGLDGTMMVENYRSALSTDFYTMKEGENTISPDLTFHGYRYVEIGGLDEPIPTEMVKMRLLSSVEPNGSYQSSNELADTLYKNITNSLASNYISIPTDCPQRNERMGWAGDAQIFAKAGSYLADTYGLLNNWLFTVAADSNPETGVSSQYAPAFNKYDVENDSSITHDGKRFGITWNAVTVTIPYNLYIQTGRTDIVKNNIENIYKYVDYMGTTPMKYKNSEGEKVEESRLTDEGGTLADHLAIVSTDAELIGNVLYYECLRETAVMAKAIGDDEKALNYAKKAEEAKTAWNEMFIDKETGITINSKGEEENTQASYATALRFGIVSDENLEKVLANYEKTIVEASTPYTLTTGFNATGNLLNALSDNGCNDTAYKLFESTDYASWLYPVTQGATSIWERWNSKTVEDGYGGNNSMNSLNHYSYGAVAEWMIGFQAGITADEDYPGYKQFILQPTVGGDFTELSCECESSYGTISSSWTAANGGILSYECTVPANTAAILYLPTEAENYAEAIGLKYVGKMYHNGINTQCYEILSGEYQFEVSDNKIVVK